MSATFRCALTIFIALISGTPGICNTRFGDTVICPVETPFSALPSVTEITKTTSESGNSEDQDCKKKTCQKKCFVDAVFLKAARFPINEFGTCGQVYETDAVIIYEDMVLQSQGNGNYLVKFVVETPNIPVTMRLQFVIQEQQCGNQGKYKSIGTITLPPITIDPSQQNSNSAGRFSVVTHRGYSNLLNKCHCELKTKYKVVRRGTARFGSLSNSTAFQY
tara:strand:- start:17925 stop:18584 length:660 start_codon:yes stop_codon:yes gene_type:complete